MKQISGRGYEKIHVRCGSRFCVAKQPPMSEDFEEVEEMAHKNHELEHQGHYHVFVWLGRSAVLM